MQVTFFSRTLFFFVFVFPFFTLGHAPHYFKLVSVQVLIRHGDRYPLYAIPKTKRPDIDCMLVPSR